MNIIKKYNKEDIKELIVLAIGAIIGLIYILYFLFQSEIIPDISCILKSSNSWTIETWEKIYHLISQNFLSPLVMKFLVVFIISFAILMIIIISKKNGSFFNFILLFIFGVLIWGVIGIFLILSLVFLVFVSILSWYITSFLDLIFRPSILKSIETVFIILSKFFIIDYNHALNYTSNQITLYFNFLFFAIILPYLYVFIIKAFSEILILFSNREIVNQFLKLLKLITVDTIRMIEYLLLFLIYLISSLVQFEGNIILIREALLAFVLIDTISCTIYKGLRNRKKNKQRKFIIAIIDNIDYILIQFISYNLIEKNVRIKLNLYNENDIKKLNKSFKKEKNFYYLITQLNDLNNKYLYPEDFYQKAIGVKIMLRDFWL